MVVVSVVVGVGVGVAVAVAVVVGVGVAVAVGVAVVVAVGVVVSVAVAVAVAVGVAVVVAVGVGVVVAVVVMTACQKHIGPGMYQSCARPRGHEGPCQLFSPYTRIEYMRSLVREGRPTVTEDELKEMENAFWRREHAPEETST